MIDWARLTELKDEIGEEDFLEVAEIFVEELSEVMERLEADPSAATQSDFHFLRGSAANLGFAGFAEACAQAEAAIGGGAQVDMGPLAKIYADSLSSAASVVPGIKSAA